MRHEMHMNQNNIYEPGIGTAKLNHKKQQFDKNSILIRLCHRAKQKTQKTKVGGVHLGENKRTLIYRCHFKWNVLFLLCTTALIVFLMCSCSSGEAENTPEILIPNPPYIIIGIDGSGSYNFLDVSKDQMRFLIDLLPAGTTVCVRWITTDSYLPSNAILTEKLPSLKTSQNSNVFNKKEKISRIIQNKQLQTSKDRFLDQINRAQRPKSDHTDILGFLVVCMERMSLANDREFHIVICTDLKNNVDKYSRFLKDNPLKGALVHILAYDHTDPQFRITWKEKFMDWGAKQVNFFAPDEDMPDIFHINSTKDLNPENSEGVLQ